MKRVSKKKIWLLVNSHRDTRSHIKFNGGKVVLPNFVQIPVKKIIAITTDGVIKNYSKVITSDGEFYSDKSLVELAKLINTDLKKISKNSYVSIHRIHKRLSLRYIFLKGLDKPIKVGERYIKKLKHYLGI